MLFLSGFPVAAENCELIGKISRDTYLFDDWCNWDDSPGLAKALVVEEADLRLIVHLEQDDFANDFANDVMTKDKPTELYILNSFWNWKLWLEESGMEKTSGHLASANLWIVHNKMMLAIVHEVVVPDGKVHYNCRIDNGPACMSDPSRGPVRIPDQSPSALLTTPPRKSTPTPRDPAVVTADNWTAETAEPWPLTVDEGVLSCFRVAGVEALFITTDDGRTWALNGVARSYAGKYGAESTLNPIWRKDPEFPGWRISISPLIAYALAACRAGRI